MFYFDRLEDGTTKVRLLNTADRPVLLPRVMFSGEERVRFETDRLDPGEEAVADISLYTDGTGEFPLAVAFVDADGYEWVRDCMSREVIRRRRLDRRARLLMHPRTWRTFGTRRERRRMLRR
ncbi:hypothetical protein [Streptomyces sp. NBC_01363]|uniref:hypothetical protein n=1 Tax=Streptomyces sp. NBC_01363 TaxID=2903840 RepID=UPI00225746D4|nr:hypothetical protein [Streptomyces sp. NBC_01363]MCX4734378.1 hypothetical protein [Streptomyces sp. NBC_01363]